MVETLSHPKPKRGKHIPQTTLSVPNGKRDSSRGLWVFDVSFRLWRSETSEPPRSFALLFAVLYATGSDRGVERHRGWNTAVAKEFRAIFVDSVLPRGCSNQPRQPISSFIYCHVAGIKRTQKKKHHRDTLPSFAVPWTLSAPFCLGSLKLRAGEPKAGLFSVPIELALEIEQRSASC